MVIPENLLHHLDTLGCPLSKSFRGNGHWTLKIQYCNGMLYLLYCPVKDQLEGNYLNAWLRSVVQNM